MRQRTGVFILILLVIFTVPGWFLYQRLAETEQASDRQAKNTQPIPVEVVTVEQGDIEHQRTFSGTLQAQAEIVVAPKVSGRIEQLDADLADIVSRDQVVARLDNDEYVQDVRQVEAELAVARANLVEAQSLLKIAERELERVEKLRQRGVSSESQRDAAKADQLAKQAHVEVTRAQVTRAESALESARIRLGYTTVTASWRGDSEQRVVAERYVDEGETVSANTPLLRIVELNPITVVFFVTERDYALLQQEQSASLTTDAYPGESFSGTVVRIAPVFRESTRQAQVELRVKNPLLRLKPGMFVRVTVTLKQADHATIVPEQALITRDGRSGLFVVSADGKTVSWRPVTIGIQQGSRVQVTGEAFTGRVVVLGQQLLDDGSAIRVAEKQAGIRP
ncbi:efflux RND transporter periplasmic adaptor subunit [Sedimenticola sp.]|uniref:efflux RND transporter periplasmic adaptor subunit n=1 Tax=Sedimenticola sp. TaxID=1940285 RepID=UPI0025888D84|nr:efflux RND transporter periplasmic adaptor subunit [Sedimenticola sp.]MCW8902892.1 efflux RND transporter periplasmic adaptor subunit [Sedimenticola sp.]